MSENRKQQLQGLVGLEDRRRAKMGRRKVEEEKEMRIEKETYLTLMTLIYATIPILSYCSYFS